MGQITQTSDKTAHWYRSAPSRICKKKKRGPTGKFWSHLSSVFFFKVNLWSQIWQMSLTDFPRTGPRVWHTDSEASCRIQQSCVLMLWWVLQSLCLQSNYLQCWSSLNQDSVTLTLIFLTSDVFRNTLHCFVSNFRTFLVRPSVFFVLEKEPRTLVPFSFCDWFVGLFKALFKLAFVPDLLTDLKVLYEQPWHEPLTTNWQNVPNCRQLLDCSNFSDYKSIYWTAQKIFWNRFTLLVVSKLGKPSEI